MNPKKELIELVCDLTSRCVKLMSKERDKVFVVCTYTGERIIRFTVRCASFDSPRIIGRGGVRFFALREMVKCIGGKAGYATHLEQVDSVKPVNVRYEKFVFKPDWPKDEIRELLWEILAAACSNQATISAVPDGNAVVYQVQLHAEESDETLRQLTTLHELFAVIGVANGCQLAVDVTR
jgi:predicted RNA-binding protein YlqC (UPF0109 family)